MPNELQDIFERVEKLATEGDIGSLALLGSICGVALDDAIPDWVKPLDPVLQAGDIISFKYKDHCNPCVAIIEAVETNAAKECETKWDKNHDRPILKTNVYPYYASKGFEVKLLMKWTANGYTWIFGSDYQVLINDNIEDQFWRFDGGRNERLTPEEQVFIKGMKNGMNEWWLHASSSQFSANALAPLPVSNPSEVNSYYLARTDDKDTEGECGAGTRCKKKKVTTKTCRIICAGCRKLCHDACLLVHPVMNADFCLFCSNTVIDDSMNITGPLQEQSYHQHVFQTELDKGAEEYERVYHSHSKKKKNQVLYWVCRCPVCTRATIGKAKIATFPKDTANLVLDNNGFVSFDNWLPRRSQLVRRQRASIKHHFKTVTQLSFPNFIIPKSVMQSGDMRQVTVKSFFEEEQRSLEHKLQ